MISDQNEFITAGSREERDEWMHDAGEHPYKSAPVRSSKDKVTFPAITKFTKYIFSDYGAHIVEDISQCLYDGDLSGCFGIPDFVEGCVQLRDCYITRDMSFWWQNRYEFLADLEISMEIDICTDSLQCTRRRTLYVTASFFFESSITYTFEGFSIVKPDRKGIRLDEYLIPIMSYAEVDSASEEQWVNYLPGALQDRRGINAYRLAKAMNLKIENLRLYRKPKTKSILYWKESKILVIPPEGDNDTPPVEVTVPADTIVINGSLIEADRQDLHILHECFHAEYHWLFYRLQDMYNNDLRAIKKRRKIKNQVRETKNPLPILEWEAKQGSRALQLPKSLILPMILQYIKEDYETLKHAGLVMEGVGRRLSDEWGIPKYLIRARMIHLGFWQAQGALNYVQRTANEGRYIQPFMFDRESCPGTRHTFVINPVDAFRLYESNEEYRARIDSGAYVYVDGHVCLNDPQYVVQTKSGPYMTDWANRHIDDCCLRFENIYEVDENYEFHLNSINSDEEYNRHYNDFIANGTELSAKEANDRQSAVIAKLSRVPGQALRELMDMNEMTQEELAEAALVSESTVQRWRREKLSFKPETALRIIVALSLPPWLSYWFLDMAKVSLQYTGIHMLYREIINCRYMDSMRTNNELIEAAGYKKLSECN